jgi:hypothetical protein
VPRILQSVIVRFGSLHPFATKLWVKWAGHNQDKEVENDAVDDDDTDELITPDANRGE